MNYTDNDSKFACVVNQRIAPPIVINAVAHAMAGLVADLPDGAADFLDYPFKDGEVRSLISRFPVIILEARNANQLRSAWAGAREERVCSNAFSLSMIGSSASEQRAQTAQTAVDSAELVALALFGPSDGVNRITRKFSLLRDRTAANGGEHVP